MEKIETLEEFFKRKFDWMPDNIRNKIGYFNFSEHELPEHGKATSLNIKEGIFIK